MAQALAVGAVVLRGDEVLLVRRANPPREGLWTLPGGRLEPGETFGFAVRREIKEETSLDVEVALFLGAVQVDRWVVLDYLAKAADGEPVAGGDALEARFVKVSAIGELGVTEAVLEMVARAAAR